MELNCNFVVLILLLVIIVLAISRVDISYHSGNNQNRGNNSNVSSLINSNRTLNGGNNGTTNIYDRFANVNSNGTADVTANEKTQSLYGFPEKDDYMSVSLREQIVNLENKFYYDNCRFEPDN